MATIQVNFLSGREIQDIHDASITILRDTGVMVHHEETLQLLGEAGAKVVRDHKIALLPEKLVMDSIARAGKKYKIYGRNKSQAVRFGYGELILMSSPGQFGWIDAKTGRRRPATIRDAGDAIRLGDALANINIVGAMA